MRVLFVTWAEPTHLYSMVPLAHACLAAGHEVRVAAPPAAVAGVTRAGLTGVAVGRDVVLDQIRKREDLREWRSPVRWPESWAADPRLLDDSRRRVLAALADKQLTVAEAMAPDLVALGRSWRPDVVVHDSLTFAGTLLGALLDVPVFGHTWGSANVIRVEMEELGSRARPEYTAFFERFGADPERITPIGWFDPCPPPMRLPDPAPRHRISVRYVPYNGPGLVPDWVLTPPERPRVCVTGGVSGGKVNPGALPEFLTGALAALTARDFEVVLAMGPGQTHHLPALPAGVRAVESLPMTVLLPTCTAVVHHGGSGTGLTAVDAGVPQLVLPQIPVAAEIGERLAHCGAGLILAPEHQHDAESIGEAVGRLAGEPAFSEAAAVLRDAAAAEPTPADRVAVLEQAVHGAAHTPAVAAPV